MNCIQNPPPDKKMNLIHFLNDSTPPPLWMKFPGKRVTIKGRIRVTHLTMPGGNDTKNTKNTNDTNGGNDLPLAINLVLLYSLDNDTKNTKIPKEIIMKQEKTKKTKKKTGKTGKRVDKRQRTDMSRNEAKSMNSLGEMTIYKGMLDNVALAVWDAVPLCSEECILHATCPFACTAEAIENNQTEKCEIKTRYLNSTMRSLKKIVKKKDAKNVHLIGMMLMPLYNQLVSFKMNEFAMSQDNSVVDRKGKINPIYKEIRSTMKSITDILTSMEETSNGGTPYSDGEAGYYEELFEQGEVPYE